MDVSFFNAVARADKDEIRGTTDTQSLLWER